MKRIKTTLIIIAFVATAGIVSTAFANGGWGGNGYGGNMMGYGGYGMGQGMMGYGGQGMGPGMMGYGGQGMGPGMMGYGYGPGYGRYDRGNYPASVSREDSNKLQQAQDKFFDETHALRNQIRDKQFALNDELNNANPNRAKVAELQMAISKLQSDYDQKALDYRLEVHKILPKGTRDFGYGNGPGYGGCAW